LFQIDTVLIKVASRCNINCKYCYVYNLGDTSWARMPKLVSDETIHATARSLSELLAQQQRGFAVVLHGGEPLLVGEERLRRILATLRNALSPECSLNIQTNGILITNAILDVCARHRTTLSISIDGPEHIHNRSRVGHRDQPTHAQVLRGIETLKRHSASSFLLSGLLAVIDPESDPAEVYEFLKGLDAPSIDFLCRDGNRSRLPSGKASLDSTEYGSWLYRLLDIYLADTRPPRIRLLDDMIKLALGGSGQKEGVGVTDFGIIVIDTDGTITKNDTLKSSFDGADRFEQDWTVHKHRLMDLIASTQFADSHALQQPTSPTCLSCPELHVCGGGMPLHRWSDERGYDNPSVYCSDQKLLISHIRKRIGEYIAAA